MSQTALITGASGGLGLEFAKIFSREGYDLLIIARREGILYKLKSELESQYHNHIEVFACDLSKTDAAYEVFNYTLEKDIQIDVLVNNAGFGDFGNFWTVDEQKQTNLLQVNIVALVQLTRYFMPGMIDRHYGKVLNLSSVASFCAGPKMSLYYASKRICTKFFRSNCRRSEKTQGCLLQHCVRGQQRLDLKKSSRNEKFKNVYFFRPANAKEVAEAGYKAMMKKRKFFYIMVHQQN